MERENFYQTIHKALRMAIADLVAAAGKTDFADGAGVARLRERVTETLRILEDHAALEDRHVTPLVLRCAPGIAARLAAAHAELGKTTTSLCAAFAAVTPGAGAARQGHDFVLQLSRFQAAQLAHMADEEEFAMPALWRAFDDETLRATHAAIVASIPPEEMASMLQHLLAAVNAPERAALLEVVRTNAPAAA